MPKQKSQRLVLNKSHVLSQRLLTAFLFTEGGGRKVWDNAQQPLYSTSVGVGWLTTGLIGSGGHQTWDYGPFGGKCLRGDGAVSANINDRVTIVNAAAAGTNTAMSLSLWIRPNTSARDYGTIMTGGASSGFWMRGTASGANNLLMDAFFSSDHLATVPFIDKVWNHYVFTYGGALSTVIKHYVNGKPAGSGTTTSASVGYDCMFSDPSAEAFAGSIDLPMIWGRTLTQQEVWQLYQDPLCMFDEPRAARLFPTPTVSIFIRPDTDASNSGWTNEAGSSSNLYLSIDETSANDTDYIQSSANPVSDVVRFRISDPSAGMAEPFKVRYRYGTIGAGTVTLTATLKQGIRIIKQWVHTDATTTFQTVTQTLASAEFVTITDFTDLFVEFQAGP